MDNNQILLKIKEDIGFIKGELQGINNRLNKINGSLIHHDKKIDDVESNCDKLQEKFKPIQKTYYKLADWSMGFIILVGSVVVAALVYLKSILIK